MNTNKRGGLQVDLAELQAVPIPAETSSYKPLPYLDGDEFVREHANTILTPLGFEYAFDSQYKAWSGGETAMGQLQYNLHVPGMYLSLQWLNSYNKRHRFTFTVAVMVKVCSNGLHLAHGQVVTARMHTPHILRDINPLIIDAIQTAPSVYETGVRMAGRWNNQPVSDREAHDAILTARRHDIISSGMVEPVLQHWINPPHEEFGTGNRWCLYNAFTEAMKGLPPTRTIAAHRELTAMFEAGA